MRSKLVSELLKGLGITQSHSRPRVSNDNPYSESQFKTLKYHGTFPGRFESRATAEQFCEGFLNWYNTEHRHNGLALLTPEMVHFDRAEGVLAARQETLSAAYAAHPERFTGGPPQVARPAAEVWINRPAEEVP